MKKLERSRRKKSVVENEDSPIYGGLFDHLLEAPKLNEETNWWHEIERNTNLHTHDDDHCEWPSSKIVTRNKLPLSTKTGGTFFVSRF